jgi:hypothetical protein
MSTALLVLAYLSMIVGFVFAPFLTSEPTTLLVACICLTQGIWWALHHAEESGEGLAYWRTLTR